MFTKALLIPIVFPSMGSDSPRRCDPKDHFCFGVPVGAGAVERAGAPAALPARPGEGGGTGAAAPRRGTGRAGPRRRLLPPNTGSAGKARPGPAGPRSAVGGGSWGGGARLLPSLLPPVPPSPARPCRGASAGQRPGTAGGGAREERPLAPGGFSCGFPGASSQIHSPGLPPAAPPPRVPGVDRAWVVRGSCVDRTSPWGLGAAPARGSAPPVPACLREGGSVEFKRIKLSEVIYPVS